MSEGKYEKAEQLISSLDITDKVKQLLLSVIVDMNVLEKDIIQKQKELDQFKHSSLFYFEIYEPYYSLIKAKDKEEAADIYIEVVAGGEEERETILNELDEISRDLALVKFVKCMYESEERVSFNDVIDEFNSRQSELLIIDGSLM